MFPWEYLSDPEGPARELAANWIFLHLRGSAYKGYRDLGRGVLMGPFLSDEDETAISSEEAVRRHAAGQTVGIEVMYLAAQTELFVKMIPDETLRQSVREAVDQYDPETQCVILLRHDDSVTAARIIGVPGDPSSIHTPRAVFYREFLMRSLEPGARLN
jgi:hypothetical protein